MQLFYTQITEQTGGGKGERRGVSPLWLAVLADCHLTRGLNWTDSFVGDVYELYFIYRHEYTAYLDPALSLVYILSLIWSSLPLVKDSCLILLQTIPGLSTNPNQVPVPTNQVPVQNQTRFQSQTKLWSSIIPNQVPVPNQTRFQYQTKPGSSTKPNQVSVPNQTRFQYQTKPGSSTNKPGFSNKPNQVSVPD